MSFFPASLDNLVDKFAALPGIGRKSAQRLAFHVLALPDAEAQICTVTGVGELTADVPQEPLVTVLLLIDSSPS